MTVVNTGSVSLSYDGDRRAAYLLLDDLPPSSAAWNMTSRRSARLFPIPASTCRLGGQNAHQRRLPDALGIVPLTTDRLSVKT